MEGTEGGKLIKLIGFIFLQWEYVRGSVAKWEKTRTGSGISWKMDVSWGVDARLQGSVRS